ncbi:PA2778 family cysteine peptidase [Limnobacter humi]|uniref:PA2778 family cysteine peptidase n=1 Tax=Limnobacter humi TaxID=1778671 RepID=A0ABT1WG15_9BURK|nr:PA2778 family cysteine peptidase [Limnobacter humi]MCQ8896455.1 PA2778 family cysteine peptidase [Limnobacter humi]
MKLHHHNRQANPSGFVRHCRILILATSLALGACSILPTVPDDVKAVTAHQQPVELKDVPFFSQEDYYCGPSSLAMALNYQGAKTTPDQQAKLVYVPDRKGSLQVEMLAAPRTQGYLGYEVEPNAQALFKALNENQPVVVLLNLSLQIAPMWHYAVVVGYDPKTDVVVLRSGKKERDEIPLATFLKLWERSKNWGFVVLKPSAKVPEFATAQGYLNAAVALERSDSKGALKAYQQGMERWPSEPWFYFAAGNIQAGNKQFKDAETNYSKAVSLYPDMADAWNNLAEVLIELGKISEARAAVNKAISLGGPRLAAYRDTARKLD